MPPVVPRRSSLPPLPTRACLLLLLSGGWLATSGLIRADDDTLPKAPPAAKYAKMASHSPFSPPTAAIAAPATPPPAPVPGWADSLTATMIAQDGTNYMVTVIDTQNPQHLYLTAQPDPTTNMAVASVKWGANRDDLPTITLSKGKEFAQVRYEANTGTGAPNFAGGGPPIPGAPRGPFPGGMPAAQPFHAPLQPNPAQNPSGNSSNMIRRPIIRSQPGSAPAAPVRPGVNLPNAAVRPNPAVQLNDDDDDD